MNLTDAGEVDDVVEDRVDLLLRQTEDGGVEVDVLAAGQVGVEAGTQFEERRDAALHADRTRGGLVDAGDAAEHRRLARTVVADEPEGRAGLDAEVDVTQRPEVVVALAAAGDDALLDGARSVGVDAEPLGEVVHLDGVVDRHSSSTAWAARRVKNHQPNRNTLSDTSHMYAMSVNVGTVWA